MVHRPQTIKNAQVIAGQARFLVAKNPDEASRLKYLVRLPLDNDGWPPDVLAGLQMCYREIPIVFADSRKFAEEWTYRFLATALADLGAVSDSRAKVST